MATYHAHVKPRGPVLTHEEVESHVAEFLARGGKIQVIPRGVSAETKPGGGKVLYDDHLNAEKPGQWGSGYPRAGYV